MSNHVKCLRMASLAAIILNRTLLINDRWKETDHHLDHSTLIDSSRAKQCFGETAVLLLSEYEAKFATRPKIDRVICWGIDYCVDDDWSRARNEKYGFGASYWKSIEVDHNVVVESNRIPRKVSAEMLRRLVDGTKNCTTNSKVCKKSNSVLYLGELSSVQIEEFPEICMTKKHANDSSGKNHTFCSFLGGYGPLPMVRSRDCLYNTNILFVPPADIVEASRSFFSEMFGENSVIAFHWRRGDFKGFCERLERPCYLPIEEVARFLAAKITANNVSHIYVATNELPEIVEELELKVNTILQKNVIMIFIGRNGTTKGELEKKDWWKKIAVKYEANNPSLLIAVEKLICAFSHIFIGTPVSSFSNGIEQLRYGLGTANPHDSFICEPTT